MTYEPCPSSSLTPPRVHRKFSMKTDLVDNTKDLNMIRPREDTSNFLACLLLYMMDLFKRKRNLNEWIHFIFALSFDASFSWNAIKVFSSAKGWRRSSRTSCGATTNLDASQNTKRSLLRAQNFCCVKIWMNMTSLKFLDSNTDLKSVNRDDTSYRR